VGLATRYYFLSECCCLKFAVLYILGALSDERTSLQFQCNYSIVRVAQNPKPYFTISSETPPTWRARFPYLYPPGTGWPSYAPGQWVGQSVHMFVLYITLGQTQCNTQFIYIFVSMITMRTPVAFPTLLLNLQQSFMELELN
jgi:hypothetical protein